MMEEAGAIITAAKGESISLSSLFLIAAFCVMAYLHIRNKGSVAPKADVQMTMMTYNQITQKMDSHDRDISNIKERLSFLEGRGGIRLGPHD